MHKINKPVCAEILRSIKGALSEYPKARTCVRNRGRAKQQHQCTKLTSMVGIVKWSRPRGCGSCIRGFESLPTHILSKRNDVGVSPSGKATDSDSVMRRFESCYPSQSGDIARVKGSGLQNLYSPVQIWVSFHTKTHRKNVDKSTFFCHIRRKTGTGKVFQLTVFLHRNHVFAKSGIQ